MSLWNFFAPKATESPFSQPQNNVLEEYFSFFDFSKTEEREIYLLCATQDKADQPVLVKIKCKGEVDRCSFYVFSCVVIEIEGNLVEETDKMRAEINKANPIIPKQQMEVLREALERADVKGNPIRVSQSYIDRHLRIARTRKEIRMRQERKGGV